MKLVRNMCYSAPISGWISTPLHYYSTININCIPTKQNANDKRYKTDSNFTVLFQTIH